MFIFIKLFGMQRYLTKNNNIEMPYSENTKVMDVLRFLQNKYPALPLNEKMVLAAVNQEVTSLEKKLNPNDLVTFLPHIGGG